LTTISIVASVRETSSRPTLGYNGAPEKNAVEVRGAKVAELVDAPALGAGGATRESSSLSFRTNSVKSPECG
jgi:hypothetical protein